MRSLLLAGAAFAAMMGAMPAFAQTPAPAPAPAVASPADVQVLLADWTGAYGGQLPFDRVKVAAFKPALEEAMRLNLAEVDAIANNPAPPTFDNTIVALERSGKPAGRVFQIYSIWTSNLSTPDVQAVETEMSPKLAEFQDKIAQNAKLFARVDAIYKQGQIEDRMRQPNPLTPEQMQLVWVYWANGVKQGAQLSPEAKAKVTVINQKLASLYTAFSQNLLADESGYVLYLKAADLAGLPQSVKDAAASAAEEKGHKGEYAILNTRSSMDPFLTYSDRRDLREKVWRTFYSRGDNKDAHDNTKTIIPDILKLRAEKAHLMGYPNYAAWKLQDEMAKTPENAMHLMMQVWPSAVARIHQEVADMQTVADTEHPQGTPGAIKIEGWDYRYYAEKVRKAKYDLDMNQVKPYLQLDKVRDGMFWAAGQLYGFTFTKVDGVPTFAPAMQVYEVKDRAGKHVGLWYFDPYARPGKNSGAWMDAYRPQQKLDGVTPTIVSNNANFVKPTPGQPVLISWDDGITMFHEFGHALHGLNSNVTYPSLASPSQAQDFVEFPSQLNENWLSTPEVLSQFAVDVNGKPIPADLVAKIQKAKTFNQGFDVGEYLASAIMDMKFHMADPATVGDPDVFEKTELAKLNMPSEMVMRHRTPQFGHIFSGDGYAAGYYSYIWAEVLDHDAYEAFTEAGGPYDKAMAKKLHDDIMQVGYSVDPALAYRNFRGRDPEVAAYLRSKGFPVDAAASAPAKASGTR